MFQMRCGKACRLSLSVKLEVRRTSSFYGEGFNIVCAKPPLRRAESRFAEPRFNFWEGFNFVRAKPPLRRADSRFAKPRKFHEDLILLVERYAVVR